MTNARRNRFKFRAADTNFGRQSGRRLYEGIE